MSATGSASAAPPSNRIQNHREGGIADVYDQHNYADETGANVVALSA
jgi:hypothetical protein